MLRKLLFSLCISLAVLLQNIDGMPEPGTVEVMLVILCSLTCPNLPLLNLQDINVMAEPGTLTALVGGSGAGKTVSTSRERYEPCPPVWLRMHAFLTQVSRPASADLGRNLPHAFGAGPPPSAVCKRAHATELPHSRSPTDPDGRCAGPQDGGPCSGRHLCEWPPQGAGHLEPSVWL